MSITEFFFIKFSFFLSLSLSLFVLDFPFYLNGANYDRFLFCFFFASFKCRSFLTSCLSLGFTVGFGLWFDGSFGFT